MGKGEQVREPGSWIESAIVEFVNHSRENRLKKGEVEKAWDEPLVAFSNGGDPLYGWLKGDIGDFLWLPAEIFQKAYPNESPEPSELTVISWVLPQTQATKADNRQERFYPSERWARARIFGEAFNERLRSHVVETCRKAGIQAVAPVLHPDWRVQRSEKYGFASNWSERHAAHVAGLGTFGLCDGLITPRGKAMRVGSVVARIEIPQSPRPYVGPHAYCLFFSEGTCGKCIDRCPVGALSERGHDKARCYAHLHPTSSDYVRERFGFDGYGCGLCQTGVPCESGIPESMRKNREESGPGR